MTCSRSFLPTNQKRKKELLSTYGTYNQNCRQRDSETSNKHRTGSSSSLRISLITLNCMSIISIISRWTALTSSSSIKVTSPSKYHSDFLRNAKKSEKSGKIARCTFGPDGVQTDGKFGRKASYDKKESMFCLIEVEFS